MIYACVPDDLFDEREAYNCNHKKTCEYLGCSANRLRILDLQILEKQDIDQYNTRDSKCYEGQGSQVAISVDLRQGENVALDAEHVQQQAEPEKVSKYLEEI